MSLEILFGLPQKRSGGNGRCGLLLRHFGDLSFQHLGVSENIINLSGQLPKCLIGEEVLISKLIILTGLSQNKNFHHKFKFGLLKLKLCRHLETRRSHGVLGIVVPIREVRVIMPPWVVGFRVRFVPVVIVHKVDILLGRPSRDDRFKISIGMLINFVYLIIECGRDY